MLRLAFDFIITWRETRTRPNAYSMETDINRLKVVLAEKKRTNKWLCEQLNVNPSTVSKWCTNSSQPDLETLVKISHLLDVELDDLVNKKFIISQ